MKQISEIKSGYYIANEVNGVWFEEFSIDDQTTVLMSVTEFYDSLSTASSNIACFLDTDYSDDVEIMEKIFEEYGIR